MIFFIYGAFYFPFFFLKGKHREGWAQRWGEIPQEIRNSIRQRPVIWIHAVSVGEARLACHLVREIRRRLADVATVLTTTTASGRAMAREELGPEAPLLFFPFDLSFVVKRFIRTLSPSLVVILETEIWPNLMRELRREGIPILIANARISDRAYWKYRLASFLLKGTFREITACLAQSERYRQRFIRLGFEKEKVSVAGNMKFDLHADGTGTRPEDRNLLRKRRDELFLICASTHPGEEEICVGVFIELVKSHPGLRLVIAPRHLERLESVEAVVKGKGLETLRLSRIDAVPAPGGRSGRAPVILVDRWGVLGQVFETAEIVFMGGSLVRHGGHDPTEPAFLSRAILHGPHMENFAEMVQMFQDRGASHVVRHREDFERVADRLLRMPQERREMGLRARRLVEENRGATERIVHAIVDHMGRKGGAVPCGA